MQRPSMPHRMKKEEWDLGCSHYLHDAAVGGGGGINNNRDSCIDIKETHQSWLLCKKYYNTKACQRLLLLNAVTAKVRLTNKSHKKHLPDFLYIWSGRLRTVSLDDFLPSAPIHIYTVQFVAQCFYKYRIFCWFIRDAKNKWRKSCNFAKMKYV